MLVSALFTPSAGASIGGVGSRCGWVDLRRALRWSSGGQRGNVVDGVTPRPFLAGGPARSYRITQTSPYTSAVTYSAEHTWWALADSNCMCFLS